VKLAFFVPVLGASYHTTPFASFLKTVADGWARFDVEASLIGLRIYADVKGSPKRAQALLRHPCQRA